MRIMGYYVAYKSKEREVNRNEIGGGEVIKEWRKIVICIEMVMEECQDSEHHSGLSSMDPLVPNPILVLRLIQLFNSGILPQSE